jgi:hypothetical protein
VTLSERCSAPWVRDRVFIVVNIFIVEDALCRTRNAPGAAGLAPRHICVSWATCTCLLCATGAVEGQTMGNAQTRPPHKSKIDAGVISPLSHRSNVESDSGSSGAHARAASNDVNKTSG